MFVPKSSESELFGTILPSGCRSARNSARFAVDTTADFFADFLAALVVALAAPDVRTSHTLGIRLAGLRRPVTWEIRRVSPLSLGSCCLARSCTAWLSLIWAKVLNGRGRRSISVRNRTRGVTTGWREPGTLGLRDDYDRGYPKGYPRHCLPAKPSIWDTIDRYYCTSSIDEPILW